jgi:hypothetical protein
MRRLMQIDPSNFKAYDGDFLTALLAESLRSHEHPEQMRDEVSALIHS